MLSGDESPNYEALSVQLRKSKNKKDGYSVASAARSISPALPERPNPDTGLDFAWTDAA